MFSMAEVLSPEKGIVTERASQALPLFLTRFFRSLTQEPVIKEPRVLDTVETKRRITKTHQEMHRVRENIDLVLSGLISYYKVDEKSLEKPYHEQLFLPYRQIDLLISQDRKVGIIQLAFEQSSYVDDETNEVVKPLRCDIKLHKFSGERGIEHVISSITVNEKLIPLTNQVGLIVSSELKLVEKMCLAFNKGLRGHPQPSMSLV
jgi:hypothetical protein